MRTDPREDRGVGARVVLAAAVLLGLDRFVALGSFGLWYDEALTWAATGRLVDLDPWTYPLWYPAVRAVVALAGGVADERTLRLLPAAMGFLGIVATWWAFRPFAGRRVAAGAALLLAASPWHLYLSQTARPYTSALTLTLVGAGLVLRGLARGRTGVTAGGLAVAAAAALFHPMALFGAVGLAIAARARHARGSDWRAWHVAALAVLLVAGAAAVAFVQEEVDFALLRERPDPVHFALSLGFHVGPLVLTGCAVGALVVRRTRDPFGRFALQTALLMVAVVLALGLFVRVTARYALWALPWLCALACVPLGARARRAYVGRRRRFLDPGWAWLALLVLPQLPQTGLYFLAWNGNRPQWREAYTLVDRLRSEGDVVVGHADLVGWYYLGAPTDGRPPAVRALQDWQSAVREADASGGAAWIVLREEELADWPAERPAELRAFLREECRLVESFVLVPTMGRNLTLDVYACPG